MLIRTNSNREISEVDTPTSSSTLTDSENQYSLESKKLAKKKSFKNIEYQSRESLNGFKTSETIRLQKDFIYLTDDYIREHSQIIQGPTPESNWVIPGRLLVGAYPLLWDDACNLSFDDLEVMLKNGVNTFVCLQSEYVHTTCSSKKLLQELGSAAILPYIFKLVDLQKKKKDSKNDLKFYHLPIEPSGCADDVEIIAMAVHICICILSTRDRVIYMHDWEGHGRIGVMVAVILGMLFEITSDEALTRTQLLHDSREYALNKRSPQTNMQQNQVHRILSGNLIQPIKEKLKTVSISQNELPHCRYEYKLY